VAQNIWTPGSSCKFVIQEWFGMSQNKDGNASESLKESLQLAKLRSRMKARE